MALVLFDCDGVLVNTEELVARAARNALSAFGLLYSEEAYEDRFLGASMDEFRRRVNEDCMNIIGVPVPEQVFVDIHARYSKEEAAHIQAIAGVRDFIESLVRSHVSFAVASNSNRANIERKLLNVGLYDFFAGHVFSREDVVEGKPAPDIYLHAMRAMGETDPKKCIVIEDSSLGVMAGRAAGMHVLGFADNGLRKLNYEFKLKAAGADFTSGSMAGIAFETFSQIDAIDQGPNHRNAPILARRRAGNPVPK